MQHLTDEIIAVSSESQASRHGRLPQWQAVIDGLPKYSISQLDLVDGVAVSSRNDDVNISQLKDRLLALSPWRKGPFNLFGLVIDTEWRSDVKWRRIVDHLDLNNKRVLDVGCGNGYYMFRMLGAGAKCVLGVDPVALYIMQFKAINQYCQQDNLQILPIGLEQLPSCQVFDLVFSMGVLYHRRQPVQHLCDLKNYLSNGGELVLETLVISGSDCQQLIPQDRYAGMRNVWSLPTIPLLVRWLEQSGFKNIECLDCSKTTLEEQRQTSWMTSYSLSQFLHPNDDSLTIEGHPAPIRAMMKCSV